MSKLHPRRKTGVFFNVTETQQTGTFNRRSVSYFGPFNTNIEAQEVVDAILLVNRHRSNPRGVVVSEFVKLPIRVR